MSRMYRQGGPTFQRPENALKRAEELEAVGQRSAAVTTLHDALTSRKHRTWSKALEQLLHKFIDLCVEEKKGRFAKEGLAQYRNVCQNVNINSLEEVIKYYLKKATDKADEARAQADAVTIDVEDLEQDANPEDLMLSYVSGDKNKDRTDREYMMPWFRFLWETYRNILDILRNNAKLESLYAMTANRAFQFCLTYKRTTEFRRLCDILRNHLANLQKRRDQRDRPTDRPDLSQPETLQLYMDTRFEQLKVACELEMWQEAFRSVEDIQGLAMIGRKSPKPQLRAVYYSKLTDIFTKSNSLTYLGYAWYQLFTLTTKYNRSITTDDKQLMACATVLAALSIPPYDKKPRRTDDQAVEQEKTRAARMAALLNFSVDGKQQQEVLDRSALLVELANRGILAGVTDDVRQVHALLETDFNPLQLCQKMAPLLDSLVAMADSVKPSPASPLAQIPLHVYIEKLKQIAVLRLLQQLSQVYEVMEIQKLSSLVPFLDFGAIEATIMDAVHNGFLSVRIDHRHGTVHFGAAQLETDRAKGHLMELALQLNNVIGLVSPRTSEERVKRQQDMVKNAMEKMEEEHKKAVARKVIIERRKEQQERALLEAERAEEERRQQLAYEQRLKEEERQREEARRREEERLRRELEQEDMEAARKLAVGRNIAGADKMSHAQLMEEALKEQMREKMEFEKRMHRQAKQMDHLERARREEERPFLEEAMAAYLDADREHYERVREEQLTAHRKAWEINVAEKHRIAKMLGDANSFKQQLVTRRDEEFKRLRAAQRESAMARRKAAHEERVLRRKQEFVTRCRTHILEKAKQIQEEKARAEREAKQRKLDELAERQRQRELEIEQRMREEKERLIRGAAEPAPAPAARGGYVPPSMRNKMRDENGSAEPPAPRRAEQDGWRGGDDGDRRPRDAAPPSPAEDRGSSGKFVPRALRENRDSAPPAAREAAPRDTPSRDAPPREAAPRDAAPRGDAPASSGGRYVPRFRRDSGEPEADGRPQSSAFGSMRRDDRDRRDGPPRRDDDRDRERPRYPPRTSGSSQGRW